VTAALLAMSAVLISVWVKEERPEEEEAESEESAPAEGPLPHTRLAPWPPRSAPSSEESSRRGSGRERSSSGPSCWQASRRCRRPRSTPSPCCGPCVW
jgi:hypothetical protein